MTGRNRVKNHGEKWSRMFYFEILLAPSGLLQKSLPERLNWPGRLKFVFSKKATKIDEIFIVDFELKD